MKKASVISILKKPKRKRPGVHSKKRKPEKKYRGQGK